MESCFYTPCNSLILGCKLYQSNAATAPVADGFYSDGTSCYQTVNGFITVISPCDTGPATGFQVSVARYANDSQACGNTGPFQTLYAHESSVPFISTLYSASTMLPGTEFDGGDLYFKCT